MIMRGSILRVLSFVFVLSGCSDDSTRAANPSSTGQITRGLTPQQLRSDNREGLNPENSDAAMQAELGKSGTRLLSVLVENMDRSIAPIQRSDVLRAESVVMRALTKLDDTLHYIRKDTSILFQEVLVKQSLAGKSGRFLYLKLSLELKGPPPVSDPSEDSSEDTDSFPSDDDSAEDIEPKWQKESLPTGFDFTPEGVNMLVRSILEKDSQIEVIEAIYGVVSEVSDRLMHSGLIRFEGPLSLEALRPPLTQICRTVFTLWIATEISRDNTDPISRIEDLPLGTFKLRSVKGSSSFSTMELLIRTFDISSKQELVMHAILTVRLKLDRSRASAPTWDAVSSVAYDEATPLPSDFSLTAPLITQIAGVEIEKIETGIASVIRMHHGKLYAVSETIRFDRLGPVGGVTDDIRSAFGEFFYIAAISRHLDADLDFLHKILDSLARGHYKSRISEGTGYNLAEVVARVSSQTESGGRDRIIHFKSAIKHPDVVGNTPPESIDLSIGDSIEFKDAELPSEFPAMDPQALVGLIEGATVGSVLRASVIFGQVLPDGSNIATLSWKVSLEPKDVTADMNGAAAAFASELPARFTVSSLVIRESIEVLRKSLTGVGPSELRSFKFIRTGYTVYHIVVNQTSKNCIIYLRIANAPVDSQDPLPLSLSLETKALGTPSEEKYLVDASATISLKSICETVGVPIDTVVRGDVSFSELRGGEVIVASRRYAFDPPQ